jgi:ubiquinone/menaquinone biosynthesis C-methylase UbiE
MKQKIHEGWEFKNAEYYDLIYSGKNYKKESERVHAIIRKYCTSGGTELLDVACGTGNHIVHLKKHYRITGTDISKTMLAIARKKYPRVKFVAGDMRSFDLKKKFDAVACLFSSVGYMKTPGNLEKAIGNFSRHLKPGGVMIIEAFVDPKAYRTGSMHAIVVDGPGMKLVRAGVSKRRGNVALLDFHFLVVTSSGVSYFKSRHDLGLFSKPLFLRLMRKSGMRALYLKDGLMKTRGLYVGIKK